MSRLEKELQELELIKKSRLQAYNKVKERIEKEFINEIDGVMLLLDRLIEYDIEGYKDAVESAKWLYEE